VVGEKVEREPHPGGSVTDDHADTRLLPTNGKRVQPQTPCSQGELPTRSLVPCIAHTLHVRAVKGQEATASRCFHIIPLGCAHSCREVNCASMEWRPCRAVPCRVAPGAASMCVTKPCNCTPCPTLSSRFCAAAAAADVAPLPPSCAPRLVLLSTCTLPAEHCQSSVVHLMLSYPNPPAAQPAGTGSSTHRQGQGLGSTGTSNARCPPRHSPDATVCC
jgi:hypothetical protein